MDLTLRYCTGWQAVVLDAMPLALPFRNVSSMSQFVRVLAYVSEPLLEPSSEHAS